MSRKASDTPAAFHITDLASYSEDIAKFEKFLSERVASAEDAQRLIDEFDAEQAAIWNAHDQDSK